MRIKHHLWRVSNGWLLVPETSNDSITPEDASGCTVFKSLEEFAKWKPKRERRKRSKPTPTTGYAAVDN